ncbi:Ppx/GppA phosphatase family protein [Actinomyces minihominis]|uniref:Ppx/GppA phosphatase family protein n=1 Tax=Actinomyces minihominis TaxID=2002838 RepID=UPI001F5CE161|nr:Ppx/GppA phosphatase family protein [Actinomyces minihominis]
MMPEFVRAAAIDCGTNSIRLLIADRPVGELGARDLVDVERDMVITRLGQGVDQTGALNPDAIERTLAAAQSYQRRIEEAGASTIRIAATSASRDASNREIFVRGMREIFGIEPEVITGKEEAALSFNGAISSLPTDLEGPYLVVDIGGGSTEFVLGKEGVEQSVSMNMGSVRVTERFGPEPWTADKLGMARSWIDGLIDEAAVEVDIRQAATLVGVAGTVTSIAALIGGVSEYSPEITHGLVPTEQQWSDAISRMINDPVVEKALQPAMPPGRADVIGGGALIWERILVRLGVIADPVGSPDMCPVTGASPVVVVSEHDILDGLALSATQPVSS